MAVLANAAGLDDGCSTKADDNWACSRNAGELNEGSGGEWVRREGYEGHFEIFHSPKQRIIIL